MGRVLRQCYSPGSLLLAKNPANTGLRLHSGG
jgi:hypothetical protein